MKTTASALLSALCLSALTFPVAAQPTPGHSAQTNSIGTQPPTPPTQTAPDTAADKQSTPQIPRQTESIIIQPKHREPQALPNPFAPPTKPVGTNTAELRLNFRNAPLEMVLNYLSDAAGFIIVLDTRITGTVNIISSHPVTREEAVDLLNTELNRNNYAAIREGRTLTIVDKSVAKTRNIPVRTGNIPANIPKNDEIVTQIIPIRFVEARQLTSDLAPFLSSQATITANETGNAILITDTQANIRHLVEIIQAVDSNAEAETEIRVFRLKNASPTDIANELGSIFPSSSGGSQSPIRFGGGSGGFFSRMMGGGGGDTGGQSKNANDRIKKATQVTAVADTRIQAVIVTAPKDLMLQIAEMMTDLDVPSDRDQGVYVFQMKNGDPQQAVQVLQNMFQSGTSARTSSGSSQNSPLQQRALNSTTSMGSTTPSGIGGGTTGGGSRTGL